MDVCCALSLWPAPHSVYWSSINDRAQDPFQGLETARVPCDTLRVWKYFTLCSTREPHFLSPGSHQVRPCLRPHRERPQWKRLRGHTPFLSNKTLGAPDYVSHKKGESHSQQSCSVLTHSNSALHPKENAHPGETQRAPPPNSHQHNKWPRIPQEFLGRSSVGFCGTWVFFL